MRRHRERKQEKKGRGRDEKGRFFHLHFKATHTSPPHNDIIYSAHMSNTEQFPTKAERK
jgi:hypothetical protein